MEFTRKAADIAPNRLKTLQPRYAGFPLRSIKLDAGNVLPYGSASRDCKEFYLFLIRSLTPQPRYHGIYAALQQADCGECARC